MAGEYTLYSMQSSGNCYKPRLLMHLLGLPFRLVDIDARQRRNPDAGVPRAQPERPRAAPRPARRPQAVGIERHAPLPRRGHDATCRPTATIGRSSTSGSSSSSTTTSRRSPWRARGSPSTRRSAARRRRRRSPAGRTRATRRSPSWRQRLAANDWLAGEAYSVADIALYAYTHVAGEGGFDLGRYPGISAWIARVAAEPGYVGPRLAAPGIKREARVRRLRVSVPSGSHPAG